jgi:hypothetical protein
MASRRFPELDALIHRVEAKARVPAEPDRLTAMIAILNLIIASKTDPYLLIGSLLEAIAKTLAERIPAHKRGEASVEAVRLLRDLLKAHGTI